jgi:hypothetical protein
MTLFYQKNVQDWALVIPQAINISMRTVPNSPLRRYFIDMVAETWGFKTVEGDQAMLPMEFLVDFLVRLRDEKKAPEIASFKQTWVEEMNRTFCKKYHTHPVMVDRLDSQS